MDSGRHGAEHHFSWSCCELHREHLNTQQAADRVLNGRETAAEEDRKAYFPLLDKIAEGTFAKESTDENLYHQFIQVAQQEGYLKDEETLASFNFALSIHAVAPRIEAHYKYYNNTLEPVMGAPYEPECRVWLMWNQRQHCKGSLLGVVESLETHPKYEACASLDVSVKLADFGPQ